MHRKMPEPLLEVFKKGSPALGPLQVASYSPSLIMADHATTEQPLRLGHAFGAGIGLRIWGWDLAGLSKGLGSGLRV